MTKVAQQYKEVTNISPHKKLHINTNHLALSYLNLQYSSAWATFA